MLPDLQNNKINSGDICEVQFPTIAYFLDKEFVLTTSCELMPGDLFMVLEALEIQELNVIEVQILFENKKMWFNIHQNDCNIGSVRRAESYDIPFMTLQAAEPGSKLALGFIPPTSPE